MDNGCHTYQTKISKELANESVSDTLKYIYLTKTPYRLF